MSPQTSIPADEFVRTWQTSETLVEVAAKLNTDKHLAYSRASYYRRKGVPLKKFPSMRIRPWQTLIELAESLEPGGDLAAEKRVEERSA